MAIDVYLQHSLSRTPASGGCFHVKAGLGLLYCRLV